MTESLLCPQCGSPIPVGSPAGLCPKCLVLAGLESQPPGDPKVLPTQPSPQPGTSGFVPPTVEDLAARFPQLEILELLGRGGMGAVYKARQKELDRLVAVKILPPEVSRDPAFAERFTREARALARLNHPNIIAVHDFGRTPASLAPRPGTPGRGVGGEGPLFYFVMEYVDGVNLRQAIRAGGMSPQDALAIVPQICDALQFAHDEGIVHRDIKPENILVDKKGRVKIADFGLAKLLGHAPDDVSLTGTQQVMGTLRYMAPEQLAGTKAVDHRADIYSLGVVFYELLTGELPVGRFAPPSRKVQIDVRLDEVVLRALEAEPEQRYQHASQVKTAVEQVSRAPQAPGVSTVAARTPPVPVDYVNKLIGFFITPQPEWGRAVGIPMLIVTGIWMVVALAVTFLVPQEKQLVHELTGIANFLLVPLGFLYLTVAWMIRRTGAGRVKVVAVTLCCLLLTVMLVGRLIPARWIRPDDWPDDSGLPKPYKEIATPGQPAVTYWEGHTAPVQGLAADMCWLVSAGLDGRVIVHDLMTGKGSRIAIDSSRDSAKPMNKLRCVTMARGNEYAFVGGDLGASLLKIRLNKQQENEVINVPNERGATIHTVMTCSDANRIAYITTGDKELVFYDIAQKRVVAKAPIPTGEAMGHVGRSYGNPNGIYIAVTSCNMVPGKNGPTSFESADPCKLTVFNDQGVECLSWQFPEHADFLNAQVVFPTNRELAVCLPSGKMQRWTLDGDERWQPHPAPVRIPPGRYTACASPSIGWVIWLAEGQRIIGIDADTGSELAAVQLKVGERRGDDVDSPIQALACPEGGGKVAAALWDGRVALASCELRPLLIRGTVLKSFDTSDPVISTNLVLEGKGWFANCAEPQTLRLFELPNPGVEDCVVTYRAQLNTKELKGRAYLEMWCRVPGEGESFGRGLDEAVPGGKSWAEGRQTTEANFLLKPGQRPDLIRLNLVVEGTGRVGIRYVEVRTSTAKN